MKRAILVAVENIKDEYSIDYSLDELAKLAKECEIETISKLVQKGSINSKTYIGKGKLEELLVEIKLDNPDIIIFNDELSPLMLKNLQNAIECEIADRSSIILDIFLKHAKTTEAKLEIKLAQLRYTLPRLSQLHDGFDRQGGVGMRGPGETQLELDKRHITNEINRVEQELLHLHQMKKSQIDSRKKSNVKTVALVGYTNAGKSSTMNSILSYVDKSKDKLVKAENKLFATLSTSVRNVNYQNVNFLLTDTVGFVSKLPTHLIHSFQQTLAEVKDADLIVHVIDISNPFAYEQYMVTMNVLATLNAKIDNMLVLLNKADLCELPDNFKKEGYIPFSNKTGLNVKETLDYIITELTKDYQRLSIRLPYSDAKILNFVIENTRVLSKIYETDGISIELLCPIQYLKKLMPYEYSRFVN